MKLVLQTPLQPTTSSLVLISLRLVIMGETNNAGRHDIRDVRRCCGKQRDTNASRTYVSILSRFVVSLAFCTRLALEPKVLFAPDQVVLLFSDCLL